MGGGVKAWLVSENHSLQRGQGTGQGRDYGRLLSEVVNTFSYRGALQLTKLGLQRPSKTVEEEAAQGKGG